jgi:HK97 family phage major capsid protein
MVVIQFLISYKMKTLKTYLEEKGISKEDFSGMSAEKQAEIFNEINEANADAFKSLSENVDSTSKEIAEANKALLNIQNEQLSALNKALEAQGVAIKKLTDEEKSNTPQLDLKASFEANKEAFESMKNGDKTQRVALKVAGTMLISSNVSGGNVPVEQRLDGLNMVASRQIRLLDIVSRGTASSNVISWVYQANQDGTPGGTAEGALKNQIDFDLVVNSETVKKRTAFIKISEEMLGDIDFMESSVRLELMKELLKDVESQVYEGDGIGNNLNGIRTVATAFAAGTFAGSVDEANAVDVLTVAANQIMLAEQPMPTYILMNPSDVTALKMVKVTSTDRRYVERLALVAGQLSLDGIPIIPTTLVTADDYLIGVFDLAMIFDRGAISIEVGRDSDDFTKNLVTILAEWRGLVLVKNNDRTAFVAGDFTTDAAAIETP